MFWRASMTQTIRFGILCILLSVHACSKESKSNRSIIDLPRVAHQSAEVFKRALPLGQERFSVEVQDDPEWGREELWTLTDTEALRSWDLEHLFIRFEQDRFQGLSFGRPSEQFTLEENFTLVGIDPRQVTPTDVGWQVFDTNGNLIEIRENGTWYQSFEHRPGH
jgi:hypothetical protein